MSGLTHACHRAEPETGPIQGCMGLTCPEGHARGSCVTSGLRSGRLSLAERQKRVAGGAAAKPEGSRASSLAPSAPSIEAARIYNRNVRWSQRGVLQAATIVAALALLSGCAGTSSPAPTTSSPPPTPTEATPTPTPTATDVALMLPDCVDVVPLSVAQDALGPDTVALTPGASAADLMPDPAAADAARDAVSTRVCTWGIPQSDGGFNVILAELAPAARDALVASIRAAGTFTESAVGGELSFSAEIANELGTTSVVSVFVGTGWVTVSGSLEDAGALAVAGAALDGLRAANPGL